MVVLELKMNLDSAGGLQLQFVNGLNSINQHSRAQNIIKIIPENLRLAQGSILRVAYADTINEDDPLREVLDYANLTLAEDGKSWTALIPRAVVIKRGTWYLSVQIASNWDEEAEEYSKLLNSGYYSFPVYASIKNPDGSVPNLGDLQANFDAARLALESSEQNKVIAERSAEIARQFASNLDKKIEFPANNTLPPVSEAKGDTIYAILGDNYSLFDLYVCKNGTWAKLGTANISTAGVSKTILIFNVADWEEVTVDGQMVYKQTVASEFIYPNSICDYEATEGNLDYLTNGNLISATYPDDGGEFTLTLKTLPEASFNLPIICQALLPNALNFVPTSRKVANIPLNNDIPATDLAGKLKDVTETLRNKTINAYDNTISNLTPENFRDGVIISEFSGNPSNARILSEQGVSTVISDRLQALRAVDFPTASQDNLGAVFLCIEDGTKDGQSLKAGGIYKVIQEGVASIPTDPNNPVPITTPQYAYSYSRQNPINDDISNINGKISSLASPNNKVLSESEIAGMISELEARAVYYNATQGYFPTKADLTNAITYYNGAGQSYTPNKNDYTYVLADETHGGNPTKYQYSGTVWEYVISSKPVFMVETLSTDTVNASSYSFIVPHLTHSQIRDIFNKFQTYECVIKYPVELLNETTYRYVLVEQCFIDTEVDEQVKYINYLITQLQSTNARKYYATLSVMDGVFEDEYNSVTREIDLLNGTPIVIAPPYGMIQSKYVDALISYPEDFVIIRDRYYYTVNRTTEHYNSTDKVYFSTYGVISGVPYIRVMEIAAKTEGDESDDDYVAKGQYSMTTKYSPVNKNITIAVADWEDPDSQHTDYWVTIAIPEILTANVNYDFCYVSANSLDVNFSLSVRAITFTATTKPTEIVEFSFNFYN